MKHSYKVKTAALILHDIGTKDERKDVVEDFKEGEIDFLFVYNMLLTGFDAKRLKKLYIGRVIKRHNLLQTLTRVNRTYKNFKYGYVVDFADIRAEFDATNKAYFEEGNMGKIMGKENYLKVDEEVDDVSYTIFKGLNSVTAKITNEIIDGSMRFMIDETHGEVRLYPISIYCIQEDGRYIFY